MIKNEKNHLTGYEIDYQNTANFFTNTNRALERTGLDLHWFHSL